MLRRVLLTTVAVLALAAPAAAQEQVEPADAGEKTGEQLEQAQETLQKEGAGGGQETAQQGDQPEQPAEAQAPTTGEEPVAEQTGEEVAEDAAPPPEMKFIEEQQSEQFLANDEVIGAGVVNAEEEEVGTIADLVMDQDQRLVGVVLSVGGFLGLGEKWVGVPVETVQFPTGDQPARLLVQVSKEQLENAPDFITKETAETQRAAEQARQQQEMQQQMQQDPAATQ